MKYIENTFAIKLETQEEMDWLKPILEKAGYKKTDVPLMTFETKPILPKKEPTLLRLYLRQFEATNANEKRRIN